MLDVATVLHDYEDLFQRSCTKMNGIKVDIGDVKIELQPNSKMIKQHTYCLKYQVKEKI